MRAADGSEDYRDLLGGPLAELSDELEAEATSGSCQSQVVRHVDSAVYS